MAAASNNTFRTAAIALISAIRFVFRWVIYKTRFFGRSVKIDPSTYLSRRAVVCVNGGGSITIGPNCEIHEYAIMKTYGGNIVLGANSSLNPFVVVYGHGGVVIGEGVRIATQTVIIPGNHNKGTDGVALVDAGLSMRGIEIKDNVWLGAGARILDGVTVGKNAIVGAGAVVTRSVDANTTVGGVPAKKIPSAGEAQI